MAAAVSERAPRADQRIIKAYAESLVRKIGSDGSRVLALAADPDYHGPKVLDVDGKRVLVRGCVSALAVREALPEAGAYDAMIVLTDRHAADLGESLIARFREQRIMPVDPWSTLPTMFRAKRYQEGLRRHDWLPEALRRYEPPNGYPPAPGEEVTEAHAFEALASAVLQLPAQAISLTGLLEAFSDIDRRRRWADVPQQARQQLVTWVRSYAGPEAAAVLELAGTPATEGVQVTSLGLLLDVLYGPASDHPEVRSARNAWERGYGLPRIDPAVAKALGEAARFRARDLAGNDVDAAQEVWRDAAEAFEIGGFPGGQEFSGAHPDGFRRQLREFAAALRERSAQPCESAFEALRRHDLADSRFCDEVERAHMALRLLRWLQVDRAEQQPADLAAALQRHIAEDAWVDRALSSVWSGSNEQVMFEPYQALCEQVQAERRAHDERFAKLLEKVTARPATADRVLPVERVLHEVVLPVSRAAPVLLIVVDGMSGAVATEVAEGFSRSEWTEVWPEGGQRRAVLAALPTVTKCSRASLLCGRLTVGGQSEEKRGFHELTGGPLFHKDDLRAAAGTALNPDVAAALRSSEPAVGVVLNTVDDALSKHDPDYTRWTVSTITHLRSLLEVAREQQRIVVLTSDHGHVVERGSRSDPRESADARWRPASTGPAGQGEVRLSGTRVLEAGGSIVAPWVEDLRYGRKAAGYHGGASAAEVAIPLLVFVPRGLLPPGGWQAAPDPAPAWWTGPVAAPPAPARRRPAKQREALFEVGGMDEADRQIAQFERSEAYRHQRSIAGRAVVSEDEVRDLLRRMLSTSGRLPMSEVAALLRSPSPRFKVAALRRLLNFDGYDVLAIDPDGRTLVLDIPLWRQQFGIDW